MRMNEEIWYFFSRENEWIKIHEIRTINLIDGEIV